MTNPRATVSLVVALLLVAACGRRPVYSHYEATPLAGWEKADTLHFLIDGIRADGSYAVDVGLRTTAAYPFMGLTLVAWQQILPSGLTRTDTLACTLTTPDGTIQGQGISHFQYLFRLGQRNLHRGDTLRMAIRHHMKRELLPGISDVGVTVTQLE